MTLRLRLERGLTRVRWLAIAGFPIVFVAWVALHVPKETQEI